MVFSLGLLNRLMPAFHQCRMRAVKGIAGLTLSMFAFTGCGAVNAQELRIGLGGSVTSMDPHFHNLIPNNNVAEHIYDKLVRFDSDGKLQPALALSWKNIDPLTWDFSLKPGVKFHNGEELTAEDVVFSLDRVANIPNSPGPFSTFVRDIASKEAIGKYTVRLKTFGPLPLIPNYMATIYVVSKKSASNATAEDFAQGRAAVGTGPFKLVRFSRGDRIELTRNDAYWGKKSPWEKVTLRIMTNDAARVSAFLSGDVDSIENVPTLDIERIKQFGNVVSKTSSRLIYLVLDQDRDQSPRITAKGGAPLEKNPLKDVRVRRALSMAIDRSALVKSVMNNQAIAAGQIAAPGMIGHDDALSPMAFDLEKAKNLLNEAGWRLGFELAIVGPNDRYVNDDQILQAVAAMWSRLGVSVKVEAIPVSVLAARARQRSMSVYLSGLASTTGEPSALLRPLIMTFDAAKGTGSLNNGHYSNPLVDRAVEQSMITLDESQRQRFLLDASHMSMQDVALIPLHWQNSIWAVSKRVKYAGRPDEYTLAQDFLPADR